ncbi:MAG: histidine phosphotransferase family protein [Alphaproteobacteria bacterium]|nr:histidine phosphotransferase family protein [Alphaproteobacteria bacterium]
MHIDLRVLELLSSKLCHDLVSPVGAVNNGVELVQEIGGDVIDEAIKLIGDSAQQAAHRLRLFRMAYGRAGGEATLTMKDARQVVTHHLEGGKIALSWPDTALGYKFVEHKGALKTLINFVMMTEEVLAYGGKISLAGLAGEENFTGCRIEVEGRNAQLSQNFKDALEGKVAVEEITPRTIQPYISGRFAEHYGIKVSYEHPELDRLDIALAVQGCEAS